MNEDNGESNVAAGTGENGEVIEGEFVEVSAGGETGLATETDSDQDISEAVTLPGYLSSSNTGRKMLLQYIFLPAIFLTVALLGGLRIGSEEGDFVFVRPALICLVFAAAMIIIFFKAGLIRPRGWFSESIPGLTNVANVAVLVSLFAATVQVFNSLIPERGLPFWVVSFCFLWTLGMSYFAISEPPKLMKSLIALFLIAFLTKYFLLLNLTSTGEGGWLGRLWQDPGKEALTYLLDLPRYAAATGYIQFFTLLLFLLGIYSVKPEMTGRER